MDFRYLVRAFVSAGALLAAPSVSQADSAQARGCATTVQVENANNAGTGSLRDAVLAVCAGGTITFANRFVIDLESPLTISSTLTIDGSSQARDASTGDGNLVQIIGGPAHRSFVVNAGGSLTLRRVRISNSTTNDRGGAILSQGHLAVHDSRFDGNSTGTAGGGAINAQFRSTLLVVGSTFDANSSLRGAAIYNEGDAQLENSTFSGNAGATSEGAIQNRGHLVAIHITVANNGGPGANSGGLFAFNADTVLINSVIADNVGQNCSINNGTVTAIALLAESGDCSPQFTADPQLLPLAARGGVTRTRGLAATSPAIDAGDVEFCLETDQRGVPRPLQAGCDLGAIENEDIFGDGFDGTL